MSDCRWARPRFRRLGHAFDLASVSRFRTRHSMPIIKDATTTPDGRAHATVKPNLRRIVRLLPAIAERGVGGLVFLRPPPHATTTARTHQLSSRNPTIAPSATSRPRHRAAARVPDVNGGRGQSPFPPPAHVAEQNGHGRTSPRGEVTRRPFHSSGIGQPHLPRSSRPVGRAAPPKRACSVTTLEQECPPRHSCFCQNCPGAVYRLGRTDTVSVLLLQDGHVSVLLLSKRTRCPFESSVGRPGAGSR